MVSPTFNAYVGVRSNFAALVTSVPRIPKYPFSGVIVDDVIDMKHDKQQISANAVVVNVSNEVSSQLVDIVV